MDTSFFIVVSHQLLSFYKESPQARRRQMLKQWCKQIIIAALSAGIEEQDAIIVRSSVAEALEQRGQFYSLDGTLNKLIETLASCLEKLVLDTDISEQKIAYSKICCANIRKGTFVK